jgi:uncharacterized protein (DUF362 family)
MKRGTISRRNFIRLALLGGIGVGVVFIEHQTSEMGLFHFLKWTTRGWLQWLKSPAIVGLAYVKTYEDVGSSMSDLWKTSEMPDLHGKNVIIKPNLLDEVGNELAATNPKVVGAVLDVLLASGVKQLCVGDGSAFQRDTSSVAKRCGLTQELDRRGIPFVDLNYDELVPVPVRDGWIRNTKELWLPRHIIEADYIISMPKLKTHHWAGVTLSLKNLLGVVPGSRYGWPKNIIHMNGINATILGLHQSLPPVLAVVDGVIGMQGNGPLAGTPVEHGLLAAGKDALAVDIICTQLMGFSIDTIPHLAGAASAGIGQAKHIETRGTPPDQLQQYYQAPPKL